MLSVCLYVVYMLESVKHQEQYTRNISAYDENAWYSKAVTAGDIKRRVQWLDIMAVNRTRLEISAPFPKEKLGLTRHAEGTCTPHQTQLSHLSRGAWCLKSCRNLTVRWQIFKNHLQTFWFWLRLFFGGREGDWSFTERGFTLQFPQAEPICLVLGNDFWFHQCGCVIFSSLFLWFGCGVCRG